MSIYRLARRAGVVLAAAGLAVLFTGGVASAHVTVRADEAKQGGFAKLTFRVPNEDESAGTVKLEIKLPQANPITSLRTKPMPGWTAQVTRAKLATPVQIEGAEITEAVSTITWTAGAGTRIGPGEFAEFEVSGGPLPTNTDKLVIPTAQTYDNGKVVNWDAPPPAPGAEEPEHPAPFIALGPADAPAGAQPVANAANSTASSTSDDTDTTARWLGGAGLAVGALGLGAGAGAILRSRRVAAAAKAGEDK